MSEAEGRQPLEPRESPWRRAPLENRQQLAPAEAPQRLHPFTVLFEFFRVLGRMIYVVLIVLAARLFGGRSEFGELALIALGGIGIVYAAARYATLRYAVENGALLIRSGIVFRQVRTVPLDRIQNVDLRQTLLQRIAGVVDLRIETAGGEGAEVRLSLLSADAARRLAQGVAPAAHGRTVTAEPFAAGPFATGPDDAGTEAGAEAGAGAALSAGDSGRAAGTEAGITAGTEAGGGTGTEPGVRTGTATGIRTGTGGGTGTEPGVRTRTAGAFESGTGTPAAAAIPGAARPFWSASLGSLVLMGATENRAAGVLGGIFGLYLLVVQVVGDERIPLHRATEVISSLSGTVVLAATLVFLGGLLAAGWALSIGATVVRFFGFTLRQDAQGRLVRRFGLTTQRESVIPIGRIQALRIEANWLRRRLGYWTVHVATAGSRADQDAGGETLLAPFIAARELGPVCGAVFPALALDAADWQPVSRHAIRRGFLRLFVLALAASALLARSLGPPAFLLLVPAAVASLGWAVLRWRALGYAGQSGLLLARSGVWRRRIMVVPEGKIQSLALTESPFQRRLGIATLHVLTAAAGHAGLRVVDLPAGPALALQHALSAGAARAGAWLPDGV